MTRDDIILMARAADIDCDTDGDIWGSTNGALFRFADLVAAAEREATNNAYRERNQLVALLSMLFPSGKAKTAIEGWDDTWSGCVYIDFPWGQASWHYYTDDEWMFVHLPQYEKPWDGHTTEQKYSAIAAAIRSKGKNDS